MSFPPQNCETFRKKKMTKIVLECMFCLCWTLLVDKFTCESVKSLLFSKSQQGQKCP